MGEITTRTGGVMAVRFKTSAVIFIVTAALMGRQEGDVRFPISVTTVEGEQIDVARLAEKKKVVVVTVKATWCSVCRIQLQRLKYHINQFRRCNVTFLVLIPGPRAKSSISERTPNSLIRSWRIRISPSPPLSACV